LSVIGVCQTEAPRVGGSLFDEARLAHAGFTRNQSPGRKHPVTFA